MPTYLGMPAFPEAARAALADPQLRRNLAHATHTIRAKRARAVAELDDWERPAARRPRRSRTTRWPTSTPTCSGWRRTCTKAGGHVHWAPTPPRPTRSSPRWCATAGADPVVKVKSMATQETGLNEALAAAGISALETDLAELIVQLGHDLPSHILVPAIHRNRAEIREIFRREMADAPPASPTTRPALAAAARAHLRQAFLSAKVGISGANFAIADTGSLVVVESEGNGRMCLTLPRDPDLRGGRREGAAVVAGPGGLPGPAAALVDSGADEPVHLDVDRGRPGDGPREFHLVLIDNGRTDTLADPDRPPGAALHPLLGLPERLPGLRAGRRPRLRVALSGPDRRDPLPQLRGMANPVDASLPFASSLCGACYEVCPVAINIPEVLVHLRARVADEKREKIISPERRVFQASGWVLRSPRRLRAAQRAASAAAPRRQVRADPQAPAPAVRLDRYEGRSRAAARVVPRLVDAHPGVRVAPGPAGPRRGSRPPHR